MKAVIVYYSHTGRTAAYARDIAMYLWQQGVSVSLCSTADYNEEKAAGADLIVLGCWTSGWFVVNQHPHKKWRAFAKAMPRDKQGRLLLFTTYLFRPGSMFRRMQRCLPRGLSHKKQWRLASKTGRLSDDDKRVLLSFLQDSQQR